MMWMGLTKISQMFSTDWYVFHVVLVPLDRLRAVHTVVVFQNTEIAENTDWYVFHVVLDRLRAVYTVGRCVSEYWDCREYRLIRISCSAGIPGQTESCLYGHCVSEYRDCREYRLIRISCSPGQTESCLYGRSLCFRILRLQRIQIDTYFM